MKQYVTKSEFECKCGCGSNNADAVLVARVNMARNRAGVPFIIDSGCRCVKHNANEGGRWNSAHLAGLAADIRTPTSHDRFLILESLIHYGFTRLGIYSGFIHGDIDGTKPPSVAWHGS